MSGRFLLVPIAAVLSAAASPWSKPLRAQSKSVVEQERKEFADWRRTSPLSPRRAVTVRPIGPGLSLGPATADVPLEGVQPARVSEIQARIQLRVGERDAPLARGRPESLGRWKLLASGPPGRGAITVFAPDLRAGKQPSWYPYNAAAVHSVTLTPPPAPGAVRVLGPDGVEVDAAEAGTVAVTEGGRTVRLVVRRLPGATPDESELEVYFRDGTNGKGSYPAGRFVALVPQGGGRYLLDFNRARNPFCAYNTVFPCPAPWRGNALTGRISAGERYGGGGLEGPVLP